MAFPREFKRLLEPELKDVEVPNYVRLTYAVCATEKDCYGWNGCLHPNGAIRGADPSRTAGRVSSDRVQR